MSSTQPNVMQFGSFILSEPITALTDLLLAFLCLAIILRLRKGKAKSDTALFWSLFFLGMGLSTLTGSVVHGMRHYQSISTNHTTWMFMNILSGASVFFAQLATYQYIGKRSRYGSAYRILAWTQLGCYAVLILIFRSFEVVKIQVAVGMIPVMIIHIVGYRKGIRGGGWVGAGIGASFFSAIFHTFKLSIDEVIGISFVLIAKGVLVDPLFPHRYPDSF
jgi:hypothetical protein